MSHSCTATLLYTALQTLIQELHVRSISCGITFEPRDPKVAPYPAIARCVDRGNPFDRRNDVGAMEFYGAYNVASDPFAVGKALRRRFRKDVGADLPSEGGGESK